MTDLQDLSALIRANTPSIVIRDPRRSAHGRSVPLQLRSELKQSRPLSVMMAEQIDALREWARERTVPAD